MDDVTIKKAKEILKSKMDGSVDTSYEWAETIRLALNGLDLLKRFEDANTNGKILASMFPDIKLTYDDIGNRIVTDAGNNIADSDWWDFEYVMK